ncbi:short chain dehydrogenase family protein [Mycobacterium xenopi 4042]|uniref:Short chain dehydrogenase family protein n=1 Tax=Mycobacterium xenopi 4042 TaxID=1299334 RepID=X8CJM6_MYCXE|nr:short chain dehydrogenase family protein [Mycobacterium xenopi 4042]
MRQAVVWRRHRVGLSWLTCRLHLSPVPAGDRLGDRRSAGPDAYPGAGGRPSERLDAVAERLQATAWPVDLTDTDAVENSAASLSLSELDVLVHNAGVSIPSHVGDSKVDDWRATFEVNVFGAVALTLALLPALRRAHGQVVFVNSGSGRKVSPAWRRTPPASLRCGRLQTRCATTSPSCG